MSCVVQKSPADPKTFIEKSINSKVLLLGTGNYIQSPGINHERKEYEKECIYVYNRLKTTITEN